jgi:hypothetical protein
MLMLTTTHKNLINNLLTKMNTNNEFEVMFNNYKFDNKLSIINFMYSYFFKLFF